MRVLHLIAADRWTGAAATALQAVEALRRAGLEAHLAFRPGRNLQQRLARSPWAHPVLEKERSPATLHRVLGQLRALLPSFDLVHAHLPHDHLLAWWLTRGRATPVLVRSAHHPAHLRPDPYHRLLFRRVAALGLANSAMLYAAQRLAPHLTTLVVPLALEPRFRPQPHRNEIRRRLGIPAQAFVAGTVGKLDPTRGQDLLLYALAAVPNVWGLIVGKGPFLPKLQRLARKLGVASRVVFPGYVEEGLEALYAAMDIFVFPEAGSDWAHRAVAEAAACGLPSLAVEVAGIRDLVEPGVTGDLWPRADAAALALLLARWAADANRCRRAGEKARLRVAHLTEENLASTLQRLYAAAIWRTPPPGSRESPSP